MKSILLGACLFPVFLAAQECKLVKDKDPYTRELKISSGFLSLQGATVSVEANNKEVDFFFIAPDKCFNDASTVFVYFEGSKAKATLRNAGSMNCDGYFHFVFKNSNVVPTIVQKLGTQKVAQFIFTGNDKKQLVISLLPDQQQKFMETVACISTEAKTLLK